MGVEPFIALRPCSPSRRGWRRASRHRIGPLRTLAEAGLHPVLRGIRNGALLGLALVAVLGLPILLVLGVRPPALETPVRSPAPIRETARPVRAGIPVRAEVPLGVEVPVRADVPVRVEVPAVPVPSLPPPAAAEPAPVPVERARAAEARPVVSLDLIPVLDDPSEMVARDEPPAKPARVPRAARMP